MKRLLLRISPVVLVTLGFVACGANPAVDSAPPTIIATSVATTPALAAYEPPATPTAAASADQATLPDGCPPPTDNTFLLRYPPGGYCLLYPDSHTAVRGGFDTWAPSAFRIVRGSILSTSPWAIVSTGEAAGFDPEKTARESAAGMAEYGVGLVELEVAGEPAYMVTGIPGQDLTRSLYFNHGDVSFHFSFGPDDTAGSETAQRLDEFADVLLDSLTFIPVNEPFTAADECLEPRSNEQLVVNETLDYCLLLPSGYILDQTGPNSARMAAGSATETEHPQLLVEVTDLGAQSPDAAEATAVAGATPLELLTVANGNYLSWMVAGTAGADSERVLLFYHDNWLHRLTFIPANPPQQEWTGETDEFVSLVTRSFRLLR